MDFQIEWIFNIKSDAKLTILEGTIVRGQPRTAAVSPGSAVGTPGVLIVTQSGRIAVSQFSTWSGST